MKSESRWIRGDTRTIRLSGGVVEMHAWQLHISVNTKTGLISTQPDRPFVAIEGPKKTRLRRSDRRWFINNCGRDFMKDKEVDHDWNSEMVWCRVVSPMKNGNRHEVQNMGRSYLETEVWLQELYPGEKR